MDRAEHGELILEDADGFTKGVFGTNGAVGLDRHLELVEVGALGHAGGLNLIGNAEDRGEGGIHDDAADGSLGVVIAEGADVTRLVAAALFNLDLHFETTAGEVGDHVVGIDDGNVVGKIEVGGGHNAFAVLAEHDGDFVAAVKLEDNTLEVEKDVNDVFENAVDLGVFVNDARDLDFRRRKADHGAQKDAAERIAERVAVAAFERFERDDGAVRIVFGKRDFDRGRLQKRGVSHSLRSFAFPRAR